MARKSRIRCDFCKREKTLDKILRMFREMKPTLFICVDCKAEGKDG